MYKFERKIQEAEKRGIHFSEGQMTYIRCARINGIDLLDHPVSYTHLTLPTRWSV